LFKGSARRGNRRQQKIRIGEHPTLAPTEARKVAEELIAKSRIKELPIQREQERWSLSNFLNVHYLPWIEHHLKDSAGQRGQLHRFKTWRNKRLSGATSPATINLNVVVIRAVLSKAVEWGFLKHHPLSGLKPLKVDKGEEPRMLSVDERDRLFTALRKRDENLRTDRASANEWRHERGYDCPSSYKLEHVAA
jgi:integrase